MSPATTPPMIAGLLEPELELDVVGLVDGGVWLLVGVESGVGVAESDVVIAVLVVVAVLSVAVLYVEVVDVEGILGTWLRVVICEVADDVVLLVVLLVLLAVLTLVGGWFASGQVPPFWQASIEQHPLYCLWVLDAWQVQY